MHCSRIKVLFKSLYAKQILVSIAFHTVDPIFGKKIATSKKQKTFSDNGSLQVFKRKLKRFRLSVELNELEILK